MNYAITILYLLRVLRVVTGWRAGDRFLAGWNLSLNHTSRRNMKLIMASDSEYYFIRVKADRTWNGPLAAYLEPLLICRILSECTPFLERERERESTALSVRKCFTFLPFFFFFLEISHVNFLLQEYNLIRKWFSPVYKCSNLTCVSVTSPQNRCLWTSANKESRLMRSQCFLCDCVSPTDNFLMSKPRLSGSWYMRHGDIAHLNGPINKTLLKFCVCTCMTS
jgi:hypothetical protein